MHAINLKHSNNAERLKTKNKFVILLKDLEKYYTYLKSCFNKITSNVQLSHDEETCGLIRVNTDSVIPYCIKDKQKYVPFVYFENKLKVLKPLTFEIENWNYNYIKFCYLVHGIKYDFSKIHSFLIISLDIVKKYLEPNIYIEEYWPTNTEHLLRNNNFIREHPLPSSDTESSSANFSLESNLVQPVAATNIVDTECIPKMVRVRYAIKFI